MDTPDFFDLNDTYIRPDRQRNRLVNREATSYNCELSDDFFSVDTIDGDNDNYTPNNLRTEAVSYIPGHLSSPIYDHECQFIMQLVKPRCHRHKRLKKLFTSVNHNPISTTCRDPFSCLQLYIEEEVLIKPKTIYHAREQLVDHLKSALDSARLQDAHLLSNIELEGLVDGLNNHHDKFHNQVPTMVDDLLLSYLNMLKSEQIKDNISYKEIRLGEVLKRRGLMVERDVMLINCPQHGWVSGPTNMLLCSLDKSQSRFTLLLYWKLCDTIQKYTLSIFNLGIHLIKIFESLRKIMGQDFFTLMNTWESLVLGKVITDPSDIEYQGLFESSLVVVRDLFDVHGVSQDLIADIIPQGTNEEEYRLWLEIVGISKIFGHPTLVIENLLDDLRKHGAIHGPILSTDTISQSIAIAKRDFLFSYFNKHNYYPKLVAASIPLQLAKYVNHNRLIPKEFMKNYPLWRNIRFQKNLDYDMSPDTSDLIKDSAAAFDWTSWGSNYDPCAFYHLYGHGPPASYKPRTSRRIIEHYLIGTDKEVYDKINDMCNLNFPIDDLTAEQCGKENELKPKVGRAFVKQTYRNRLYQVSLEHNIAQGFFPYLPEQSMTDPEIISMRRILKNVNELHSDHCEKVNLDLKKWNIKFRHELVWEFGEMLDELFETPNLYKYNHLWFIKSKIVTNSRLHPPDYDGLMEPIEGPYFYSGHHGGMEGMRQKLWTWITICLIKKSSEDCNLNTTLMGQGDNQVIIIHYTWDQLPRSNEIRTAFMNHLSATFESVGLELKQAETWTSKFVHEYGKTRFYNGIAISQGTKKCARLVPDANETYPTFSSPISTINTLTESIAQKDSSPIPAFIINQFSILNYLSRKKVLKRITGSNLIFSNICYLSLPADFGGLSISHIFDHIVRGHNDKVTLWLSYYKFLMSACPQLFNAVIRAAQFLPKGEITEDQRERLIHDIYSLNIVALPTLENEIKDLAMEYLMSDQVTNPQIKQLYDTNHSISEQELVKILLTMKPFYPPLAYMFFELSNAGTLIALRNKMTSVSTVNKLIQKKEGISFINYMNAQNSLFGSILMSRMMLNNYSINIPLFHDFSCPTQLAQYLRVMSWDLNIIGLTKPFPIDQVVIKVWDELTLHQRSHSISILLSDIQHKYPLAVDYERGPYSGYVGSITKDKIKKPTLDVTTKTIWIKAVKQLGTILSWLEKMNSTSLMQVCTLLIKEKLPSIPSNLSEENIYDWTSQVYGGNMFHRFFATVERSAAVINFLSNICAHFKQSTNEMSVHTSGGADFTIFYQLIFLTNMYCINRAGRILQILPSNMMGAQFECASCTVKIPDDINITIDLPPLMNPSGKQNAVAAVINFPIDYIDMSRLVEYHIAKILGMNIDKNFNRGYKRYDTNIKTDDVLKVDVSVNDLRPLNTQRLLLFIASHSDHMIDLINKKSFEEWSSDTSLTFLSQMIFDSGLKNRVLSYYPQVAVHHTDVTTLEGFSVVLIKVIRKLVLDDIGSFLSLVTSVNIRQETLSHKLKLLLRLKKVSSRWSTKNLTKRLNTSISNFGPNSIIHASQAISRTFRSYNSCKTYFVSEDSILTLWRMYPKVTFMPSIDQRPIHYRLKNWDVEYPGVAVLNYYRALSNNTELGAFSIPTLCHIARPLGNISSAFSKYLEIILHLNFDQHLGSKNLNFYCLAEGSGSTFCGLFLRYPHSKLGYTTLLTSSVDQRHDLVDVYPPALVNSGYFKKDRVIMPELLSCGETNILTTVYKNKLISAFASYPPYLVTMDAESPNKGNNYEFVDFYLELLLASKCKIMIFKLFYSPFLMDSIDSLMARFDDGAYRYAFLKPISSSTTSKEIFLVVCLRFLIDSKLSLTLTREAEYLNILEDPPKLSNTMLTQYCLLASKVGDFLIAASQLTGNARTFRVTDKYDHVVKELNACGYWCKRLISHLLSLTLEIHSAQDNDIVYPLIRKRGTNQTLRLIIKDVIFILVHTLGGGDLPRTIQALACWDVGNLESYRKRVTNLIYEFEEQSRWFDDWPSSKMFFRNSLNYKACTCNPPYSLTLPEQLEDNNILKRIFNDLKDFSISTRRVDLYKYSN